MRPPYSPSRDSLYRPESEDSLFVVNASHSLLMIAVESARMAYIRAESSADEAQRLRETLARVGFSRLAFFAHAPTGSFAFAAFRAADNTALLSFRGTQPDDLQDLLTDVNLPPVRWSAGNVHGGFARSAAALREDIVDWLDAQAGDRNDLILCGHSLGAALATLYASLLNPTLVVTLGSPRVGDKDYAESLANTDIVRVVDCCDFITKIPTESPAFQHIGKLRFIDHSGAVIDAPTEAQIATAETLGRAEYFQQYSQRPNIVLARDLADHAPINYVRAFCA